MKKKLISQINEFATVIEKELIVSIKEEDYQKLSDGQILLINQLKKEYKFLLQYQMIFE
jgi:exosome complex RNA-binding protein Rrp4